MHHPSAARPTTEAAQDRAAITELCKAVDHMREALFLMPDDSPHVDPARRVLIGLRMLIETASRGRVQP